jgi:hypothetical protein
MEPSPSRATSTSFTNSSTFADVTRTLRPLGMSSTSVPSDRRVVNVSSTPSVSASPFVRPLHAWMHSLSTASRSSSVTCSQMSCFHAVDARSTGSVNLERRAMANSAPTKLCAAHAT